MCERRDQTQFGDAAKQHSARTARIPIGPRGAYAERGLQGEAAPRDDLASASTLCRHLGAQGLVAQPIHIVYYSTANMRSGPGSLFVFSAFQAVYRGHV